MTSPDLQSCPPNDAAPQPLPYHALRWRCDPKSLRFESTQDVTPVPGVIGQESAVEALRFGLEIDAPGQNVFVRGLTGTGRMTLVRSLLEQIRPACPEVKDRVYVHNFTQPDRPRLLTLPRGRGEAFRRRMDALADFIRHDLKRCLSSEEVRNRFSMIEQDAQRQVARITEPFEQALRAANLAMATIQAGPIAQATLVPLIDGKPVSPEEWEQLRATGRVTDQDQEQLREKYATFEKQLHDVMQQVGEIRRKQSEALTGFVERMARSILAEFVRPIEAEFAQPSVSAHVNAVIDHAARRAARNSERRLSTRLYRVNVVISHPPDAGCPIVIETVPTLNNLLGTIERRLVRQEGAHSDHMMIRAGSLLRADGGYLILEARDVLREPGAWKVLVRTLRTGRLEIVPNELQIPWWGTSLKPEPIHVNIKVILVGDAELYYLLDRYDPDFPYLFKVLADFDSVINRDAQGVEQYAGVLARIGREENLLPFDKSAVAALVEHGARIAALHGKLSTRFGRLADIAREAAFIAERAGQQAVTGADVAGAVRRSKQRADLPSRRFRELVAEGTIRVHTQGTAVGQINGLAVLQAGPLIYGFPARITATIGPGTAGVINIDREAALSGAIHTKGFYILGGLLRYLLRTDHPLAFDASVAFEQSYGGIDGDSASGAEICCLLSALTDVPLRQDLAMTGAIDQMGNILAVGAVNEKVEGFFDACRDIGLTGTQGVLVPQANAGDLMLRDDVVHACREGKFAVYAVSCVHEALTLLTGVPAGRRGEDGLYPEGTLLSLAVQRAYEYWLKASLRADSIPALMGMQGEEESEPESP